MYQLVVRFARKQAMKPGKEGIMQIPNKQIVIDTTNDILTKFKKHGVPNEIIKTERDVQKILNQIDIIETENLRRRVISPGHPRHKEITEALLGKKKTTADLIDLGLVRKGKNVKKTTPKEAVDPKLVEEVKVKETFEDATKRFNQTDVVADTVTRIVSMEPVAAMKEANKIIGRKGIYKNLTKEQSQKILKDTEDWIFQRDPDDLYNYNKKRPFRDDADPEDFAQGGRTGYSLGSLVSQARQDSDGIEARLEQLGGDVTSAEKTLQDLTKRLETAGSSVPEGGATYELAGGMTTTQPPLNLAQNPQLPAGGLGTLAPGVPTGLNRDPVTGGGQPFYGQPGGPEVGSNLVPSLKGILTF